MITKREDLFRTQILYHSEEEFRKTEKMLFERGWKWYMDLPPSEKTILESQYICIWPDGELTISNSLKSIIMYPMVEIKDLEMLTAIEPETRQLLDGLDGLFPP